MKLSTKGLVFVSAGIWVVAAAGQVTVVTGQYDNSRTAANLSETILTPSNVNTTHFGLLFSRSVDAFVYAQPLYVPGVVIPPSTTPVNVVYVATMNNSVYAFDADNPSASAPLWQVNLGTPFTITGFIAQSTAPTCGIMSTPVIDPTTKTMYVVAMALVNGSRNLQLHALDITTGKEKFGGPVLIQGSVVGGHGSVVFDPTVHFQRPALLLNAGSVWLTFASGLSESISFHGWAMAYNASTLQQTLIWVATPTGNGGGVWMSGRGPSADSNGVYLSTGNGSYGPPFNYGESVVRLTPTSIDYFTPYNWNSLNRSDWDVSASSPMLLPGTPLVVNGSKTGNLYVMNRASLGHLHSGNTQIVQSIQATPACSSTQTTSCKEIHGMTYWARTGAPPLLYLWGRNDVARSFTQATNGTFTASVTNSTTSNFPGGILSLSANGNTNGILWATTTTQDSEVTAAVPGTLRALNAITLAELWNSDMKAGDTLGDPAKFCIPVVANGKVYIATFSNKLMVYGSH